MDSSNSGSFQSSSGAAADTDEYDSRNQSISSFFNPNNLNHLLQPPPPPYPNHHNTFYTTTQQPFPPLQYPASSIQQQDFTTYPVINPSSSTMDNSNHNSTNTNTPHSTKPGHQIGVTLKNPKKRTRASRRAPTTVLTTDTTNFRQMVQEFTGIPTAPFTTAPFSRRLDLFGRGSDNPLRPSASKIQQQPPFLNSTANIVESGTSNNTTTSGNYNFGPSSINTFQKQPSSFLDLQNPMFSFQSLLQNSVPQQGNDLSGASKSWREQNGKLEGFEGVLGNTQNIGGSKLNSGIESVLVSSRSGGGGSGDQVQGNEGSWICPSN